MRPRAPQHDTRMPILVIASIALQFFCLVHMARSGRPYWWAFIIIIGSFLGSAVYILTQVIPDLRYNVGAQRAVRRVQRAIDPERERRRIEAELAVADTVTNRLRLARECLELGDPFNAERLFESSLTGMHANEPDILLGLAQAQDMRGDHVAVRATLERLIEANPDYRSHDGHLLYAKALEGCGESEAAAKEYTVLAVGYPGEEARVRYGQLLHRMGREREAQDFFRQTLARVKVAPRHYREANREWIEIAERAVKGGG